VPAKLAGMRSRKAPRSGGDRLAQPIRRMNLAGVPVTVGYCPVDSLHNAKLEFWLEYRPKCPPFRNAASVLGGAVCMAKFHLAGTLSSAPFMSASREFSRNMAGLNLNLKMRKAQRTCLHHRKGLTSLSRYGAS